jgi:UDP-2,3-diacylglucosamine hydrolase
MDRSHTLFVSDLHLDADAPEAVARFLAFLRDDAVQAAALYILGDLFESWVGDDDTEPVRDAVCRALRELTRAGTPCFVMPGNRDFLLGAGFERRSGCQLLPDPVHVEINQTRMILTHGDRLCTGDTRYQEFRALARNPAFQRQYLQLPLAVRRALTHAARAKSREHTGQTRGHIMDVEPNSVNALLQLTAASLLIHGHTHRPSVHSPIPGTTATRIVLGDWYDQGSCLRLDNDGRYALLDLPRAPGTSGSTQSRRLRV